ncbi:hypothetical protein AVEN_221292-1 [Araneus ventricosus]|uniref:Uncharacterized protein n=1 Tax=Araneus ventricosus TaxID=182803 RepID=A0A4Y2B197_ARAVE|nr:hypothetical protein AVEN_221292-1 [Araneus ventricosus]
MFNLCGHKQSSVGTNTSQRQMPQNTGDSSCLLHCHQENQQNVGDQVNSLCNHNKLPNVFHCLVNTPAIMGITSYTSETFCAIKNNHKSKSVLLHQQTSHEYLASQRLKLKAS